MGTLSFIDEVSEKWAPAGDGACFKGHTFK